MLVNEKPIGSRAWKVWVEQVIVEDMLLYRGDETLGSAYLAGDPGHMFIQPDHWYVTSGGGQPRWHLLTTGWSTFVPSKRLVAGDAFVFLRFSFSTTFFSHKENIVITLRRLVLTVWLFVVLIINTSYMANLTSILIVQQLSSWVEEINSLISSTEPIEVQDGSFAMNYDWC